MRNARAVSVLVMLALAACVPARVQRACPRYTVENSNYADVVIYANGVRVMAVTGLTTESRTSCAVSGYTRVEFDVHAIGGAFDLHLVPDGGIAGEDAHFRIYIGPTPNLSYALGRDR